jgi:hypothetical protein
MTSAHQGRPMRAALAVLAVALIGLAFAAMTATASASPAKKTTERLVVRGEDTVKDGGACPAGVCQLQLADGTFRGTIGKGAYGGAFKLHVADAFPNGEGGVCAPIDGTITLGAGTPDRLVLALWGDSCQDGAGDLTTSSFTGVAGFVVRYGTGAYAKASGGGLYSSFEDANDHEHMTLIGRITR